MMEKKVKMEEKMICGEIKKINEEDCEDVMDEAEEVEE
jgi:hypothetical protein